MNFLTMEYFLSIAEHRNITKAAAELHITQQTLSAHLTALEKELDTKLFIRSSPMELTHVGTVFLKHAAIIFENYQSMWNEFNDLTNNQRGKLMIGIDFTRSRTLMPQVISAFNAEYPNIEVRLTEGTNRESSGRFLIERLILALADLAKQSKGLSFCRIIVKKCFFLSHHR